MSNQFHSDEQVLARLVREAGDPSVSPDPQYAETLRATILNRVGEAVQKADAIPIIAAERTRKMKRIAKFAVAASVLVALGILTSWMTIGGGSTNIAFANVADALDSLRSATYDVTSEAKGENGQPPATATGKGFFLAPSHQRMELSMEILINSVQTTMNHVTIIDGQAAKWIQLMPDQKLAVAMDMKIMEDLKKSAKGAPPDLFGMVRRLVREGSSGSGERAERLGKKDIDGREAVGFRTHNSTIGGVTGDMTLWADPETARPIRIEIVTDITAMDMTADVRMVIDSFRYNVDLDPSLFSLELPEGYSTLAMDATMPVEEDLLGTLRMIAKQNKGLFPAKLEMPKTVTHSLPALDKPTQDKLQAELEKVIAKYGGLDKLREKYGKELPPAVMAEYMKAGMPITQKQMQEHWQKQTPLGFKQWQGMNFYLSLKPENDPHYVGGGVKLDTPDRPIFWYKPTGADKYRVIHADLSVKDMTADDVKKLPEARPE